MKDLSDYAVRLRPQPVHQRGISVIVEPYAEEEHASDLWQALGGQAEAVSALLHYFPQPDFAAFSDFTDWLDRQNASGAWITRVFRSVASGRLVGMASYMRIDERNGSVEVGSVAHGPAMARTSMATEAHYLMAKHIFDDLGYRRYEWKCHNDNAPSHAAAKRLGFTFEGIFRQHVISKGANRDTAWYSMLDSEWPHRRAAFEAWLSPDNFDASGKQIRTLATLQTEIAPK